MEKEVWWAHPKKCLRNKLKSYGEVATDFHDREMPKMGCNHTCLSVITIDSVLKSVLKRI